MVRQERESRRGARAGGGVFVCVSVNVGETGRGDGVNNRLTTG